MISVYIWQRVLRNKLNWAPEITEWVCNRRKSTVKEREESRVKKLNLNLACFESTSFLRNSFLKSSALFYAYLLSLAFHDLILFYSNFQLPYSPPLNILCSKPKNFFHVPVFAMYFNYTFLSVAEVSGYLCLECLWIPSVYLARSYLSLKTSQIISLIRRLIFTILNQTILILISKFSEALNFR